MEHELGVFDRVSDRAEDEADERGLADLKAGRTVSHAAVKKWLTSWGTGRRLPRPQIGD
jgi:predicted transcriptional regulator